MRRNLTDRLAFQPELQHVRRVGVSNLAGSSLTLTADYLQVPLLFQLKLRPTAGLRPSLVGGPSVGYKLKCTLAFSGGGVRSTDDCDADRGVQSHRVDFGVVGGGGIAWMFGNALVSFEGRYMAGLRSFVVPLDQSNSKSYGWSVTAGVSLPLRTLRPTPGTRPPTQIPAMPPLRSEPILFPPIEASPQRPAPVEPPPLASATGWMRLVSVNAVDVDARTLLLAISREAGLNLVVSSDVQARVSVTLTNVAAVEAVQAIIQVAGLQVMSPSQPALPTVVFYHLPIDVNGASAGLITSRFGTSAEMAKWIAANNKREGRTP